MDEKRSQALKGKITLFFLFLFFLAGKMTFQAGKNQVLFWLFSFPNIASKPSS
jgi:hypothetical protein